jgi:hypothetical protein
MGFAISMSSIVKCAVLGVLVALVVFADSRISENFNFKIEPIYYCAGFVIGVLIGNNFYVNWIDSGKIDTLCGMIGISSQVFLVFIACIGVMASACIISPIISKYTKMLMDIMCGMEENYSSKESHKYSLKSSFLILLGIYLVGIGSIIRANYNYHDDTLRVVQGIKSWTWVSRFLSNILSVFIHMDNYLTDVSPLTQIISAMLVACSGLLILIILYGRMHFSLIELIPLVLLYLNPYFLECISYKYDSPYMALSILASIFPLLVRKWGGVVYLFISTIGMMVMCMTYQASSGIYPMMVLLLMFIMWNQKEPVKDILKFMVNSCMGYVVGILIFKLFIMIPISNTEDVYTSNKLPTLGELVPTFVRNIMKYYSYINTDFKVWWVVLAVLIEVGFVIVMTQKTMRSKKNAMIVAVLAVLGMGLICFGMYPFLEKPLYDPRAMYGFGVFLTLLSVCIMQYKTILYIKIPSIVLAWTFFVFSLTYGNALYTQKEYTEFRIMQVIEDMNDLEVFKGEKEVVVQLKGDIGKSSAIEAMPQDYQMLNRLIKSTFGGSWGGQLRFYNYYKMENVIRDDDIDLSTYDLPILEDHMYHTFYGNEDYILIELK